MSSQFDSRTCAWLLRRALRTEQKPFSCRVETPGILARQATKCRFSEGNHSASAEQLPAFRAATSLCSQLARTHQSTRSPEISPSRTNTYYGVPIASWLCRQLQVRPRGRIAGKGGPGRRPACHPDLASPAQRSSDRGSSTTHLDPVSSIATVPGAASENLAPAFSTMRIA